MFTRRFFFALAILSLGVGCSSGDNTPHFVPPVAQKGGSCIYYGVKVEMGDTSGHKVPQIPLTDLQVDPPVDKTYEVGPGQNNNHGHTLKVTAANFATLRANTGVELTTEADETHHTHVIVINCAYFQ